MTALALKKRVKQYIDQVDDKMLKVVYVMLDEYIHPEKEIIGYIGREPLTKEGLLRKLAEAEEDIKHGRTYTTEQAKKIFNKRIQSAK